MTTIAIASLLPTRLNANGDAENAAVLAVRARLRGHDASVIAADAPTELPEDVHAVVVGSCDDPSLAATLGALLPFRARLIAAVEAGVPIVAVANGWKLLTERVEITRGEWVEGLGIVSGESPLRERRSSDDLVVDVLPDGQFPAGTRLVGYENHARDFTPGVGVAPLGRTVHGRGNGNGSEGAIVGAFIGTHLHGPVLAKNPVLADHVLAQALVLAGDAHDGAQVSDVRLNALDAYAAHARDQIVASLSH